MMRELAAMPNTWCKMSGWVNEAEWQQGCSVTFCGLSEIGKTTLKEFSDKGYKVQFLQGDMGEEPFCKELVMNVGPVVRVNTLSPGWIWTREVDKAAGGDREKWGAIWGKFHMLRRLGTVEECASAAAFLLSDEASFVTSTELMVDGGYRGMGSEGLGEASEFAGSS